MYSLFIFRLGNLRGLFCQRCLHDIANLCANYRHRMLLLLLFVLLPLQSHFTPLPSKEKKSQKISVYALTKGYRSKRKLSKSFTVVIQPLATRLIKPKVSVCPSVARWTYRQTDRQTDTYSMEIISIVGVAIGFAPWMHMIPEMYVTLPLPCPSSPASWTLLSPLSVQESRKISSNDRHHHKLSSLNNNKTGILYPFPNVSLMLI